MAGVATIGVLEAGGEELYDRIRSLGIRLQEGIRRAAAESSHNIVLSGPTDDVRRLFRREKARELPRHAGMRFVKYGVFTKEMLDRGIRLIGRGIWYISTAHTEEDIDRAIETAFEVMSTMKQKDLAVSGSAQV